MPEHYSAEPDNTALYNSGASTSHVDVSRLDLRRPIATALAACLYAIAALTPPQRSSDDKAQKPGIVASNGRCGDEYNAGRKRRKGSR